MCSLAQNRLFREPFGGLRDRVTHTALDQGGNSHGDYGSSILEHILKEVWTGLLAGISKLLN